MGGWVPQEELLVSSLLEQGFPFRRVCLFEARTGGAAGSLLGSFPVSCRADLVLRHSPRDGGEAAAPASYRA